MVAPITDIMEVCLLAGKVMLQSGAETYRVEDTMNRIARACALNEAHSYVTPTGIFLSIQGETREAEQTRFLRISERLIDLNKIVMVNDISRKISEGDISLNEAYQSLREVEKANPLYSTWLQLLAAAFASGFFAMMFGGSWADFGSAFLAGGAGYLIYLNASKMVEVKFFAEVLASFIIGIIAYFLYHLGWNSHIDKVIIGSLMPLVPGVLITNAVRDLMAGDLVSGLARGAEAFFTALAVGTGIAVALSLLS
ncbi:threonine/serine exporter family protein [Desulfitobacterium sp.]|uniref:threonine/serine exporter family protein n=1 Tax=Desulfitobacterium sp. TaxID=49981 RepID=UPI002C29DC6C|nr:threonine/serine exporter family protein [Desulfitobacterium sp.]HVJ48346.1 threonine/serine exporter family protein [Desulfitobacterium sp.]